MPDGASAWADLSTRILSALAMMGVTALALAGGGAVWGLFVLAVTLVMFWELAALCEPGIGGARRIALALTPVLLPAVTVFTLRLGLAAPDAQGAAGFNGFGTGLAIGLALALLVGVLLLRAGRLIWAGYGAMVLIGALFLVFVYQQYEVVGVLMLVIIIAISDTFGYFFGRLLGGPKFWPRVSPKKTWSGTVAGWIGAALFGFFVLGTDGTALWAALAALLLALAGQMGDIAESALKRRVGVKDASALIPGHGGFLDRLDALVAASALAGLLSLVYMVWTS
jgi:phosphatidate cytidylyltransferase